MAHDNFIDKRRRRLNLRDVDIENVLPEYFGSTYPKFITLLEKYYEWQDQNDSTELINHLFASRDITETDLTLLDFIEDELLLGGSYFAGSSDKRAASQFSSVLFRAKGSKYSIEWFFRSFFNIDPEVVYTKENVFLIADSKKPESFESRIGAASLRYLTNDKLYQTFAILVRAGIPVNEWKKLFKLFVHPAGIYLGGEVLLEGVANLGVSAQASSVVDSFPTPILELNPNTNTTAEGIDVTFTVDADTNAVSAQTYLYPGEYKWYLEHVSTEDADFVDVPPQKIVVTAEATSEQNDLGSRDLELNQTAASWVGYDIEHVDGSGNVINNIIPRGSYIVAASGSTATLSEPMTHVPQVGDRFRVTGGWQNFNVEVKSELLLNAANPDVPGKVYDRPTAASDEITLRFVNDYDPEDAVAETGEFLGQTEEYKLHVMDWCRTPYRKKLYEASYFISNVWWDIEATPTLISGFNSMKELGTPITLTINGYNLPTVDVGDAIPVRWYLEHITTSDDDFYQQPPLEASPENIAITGGTGFVSSAATITIYPKKDYITEGNQNFRIHLSGPGIDPAGDTVRLDYFDRFTNNGKLHILEDSSIYPRYNVSAGNITEGGSVTATVSTITGTPDSGDGSEHNPNGDVLYTTSLGVQWEILDDLDGRITTTSGRIAFNAASQTPTLSATTVDGYYRGTQTSTVRITNHDAIVSTDTFTMVDAAPSAAVITGPTAIAEGASGSWTFTRKNTAPGTTYYWWVTGAEDADFTSVPRTGSRSTLTVDTTAASVTAGGDTMIMTSTMDLTAVLDQLPPEGTQNFVVNVSDTVGGAAIATFNSSITDVVPVYEVLTSAATYAEGSTVIIGLNVTNSVGEDVDYAIEDDGTGRYSVAGGTFTWTGTGYANINLPTTILSTTEGTQTITITVTGQGTGIQDTVEFDLVDRVPTYGLVIGSPVVEGNDITLDLTVSNPIGETVSWALTGDTQGRASASSGDFTSPTYANVVVGTTENTGFVGPEVWTFTVTGDDSGQTAQQTVTVNEAGIVRTNVINMAATSVTEGNGYSFTVTQTLQNTNTYVDFAYEITGDTRANVGSTTITAATFASNSGVVTISPTTTSSDVYQGPQTVTISGTGTSDTFSLVDAATVYNAGSFNVASIAEQGGVARFTLSGTNIPNGTLVPYTITGVQAADIDVALTGNITMGGSNSGFIDVTAVYDDVAIEGETITLTAGGQSDTVVITDAVPSVTYTASTNTPVTEGSNIQYTIVATQVNGGSYEDVTVTITGTASNRVTDGTYAITAAEFTSGSGTVTKNYSVINDFVYQGNENVTLDAVGATYGNSAPQQTVTITDQAAAINSVTGPTSINDGGTAPSSTVSMANVPNNITGNSFFYTGENQPPGQTVDASSGYRFQSDFTVDVQNYSFFYTDYVETTTWLTGATTEVGSDYEIRFQLNGTTSTSGGNQSVSFPTNLNSWSSLGSVQELEISAVFNSLLQSATATYDIDIRDTATQTIQSSRTVTISVSSNG